MNQTELQSAGFNPSQIEDICKIVGNRNYSIYKKRPTNLDETFFSLVRDANLVGTIVVKFDDIFVIVEREDSVKKVNKKYTAAVAALTDFKQRERRVHKVGSSKFERGRLLNPLPQKNRDIYDTLLNFPLEEKDMIDRLNRIWSLPALVYDAYTLERLLKNENEIRLWGSKSSEERNKIELMGNYFGDKLKELIKLATIS